MSRRRRRRAPIAWRTARWFDDRLSASRFARTALDKIFPDHWSFMLGEISMYAFLVLLVTGAYLTFFFVPSLKDVVYNGPYAPLRGTHMSEAYRSTIDISFSVRAGLVMRQIHHWAAVVFVGAIVVHLARVFFTGAFRRPRELNWVIGVVMMILAIVNGFAGYSLPDDLLSGTGLRVAYSIMESIPFVGTWLAFLVFGGPFPSESIISRLYVVHILLVPAAILGLLGAHLAIMWHQKHTQFRDRGRTEDNVVGVPLYPTFMAKSTGFMLVVTAVLAALGGLAQINPIWLYGPFRASQVSSAAQPDWYMGWLDGALRVFPNWEPRLFGHTIGNLFFPGVLLPGITFGLLTAWPWLEAHFGGDHGTHNLLDSPREAPVRTAFGVAAIAFYTALFVGGGTDVIAVTVNVSENAIIWAIRVLLIVLPPLTGYLTYRFCSELSRAGAGRRTAPLLVVRGPGGGYLVVGDDGRGPGTGPPVVPPVPAEAAAHATVPNPPER
ncbi:MAG: ubiquinol-cytochrome c reductase cytochrome b subunit [Acidimicrobiales bacterium]